MVESGAVSPEGSEESFDLALGCVFSNATQDALDLMVPCVAKAGLQHGSMGGLAC